MLLSVIIPVYKSEKYIRHTLQSIFGQAFDRSAVEVIVVNDGTPDNSMKIVREFAAREPGIQIIEQENRGLSAARNAGLVRATGKYIWFVDSDDWIEDGFLKKAIPLIREDDTDVFLFRIREHRESDGKIVLERKLLGNEIRETDFLELLQAKIDFTPVQLFLIRKELMDAHQLKFVEGVVHEDMEFAPRMLAFAKKIKTVPWFHYNYLWRESGSLTSSPTNRQKRIESLFRIIDLHRELSKNITNQRNARAMETVMFWLYRKVYNFASLDEFDTMAGNSKGRLGEMKTLVRKNLFYRATSMMFIHRMMFLVSPRWPKKSNKVL